MKTLKLSVLDLIVIVFLTHAIATLLRNGHVSFGKP